MTIEEEKEAVIAKLKQGWTQGREACGRDGEECDPRSQSAIEWCLAGAHSAVSGEAVDDLWLKVEKAALKAGFGCATEFNDASDRTVEEVIELVRSC